MTLKAVDRVAPDKNGLPARFSIAPLTAGLFPEKVMTMSIPRLEQNLSEFLDDASLWHGKSSAERFSQEMYANCIDLKMQSPIEKILWVAVHVVCGTNTVDLNGDPISDAQIAYGMHLFPQYKLDRYRADFYATYRAGKIPQQDWIIECDGHAFHERTKDERQKEKQRDRYFTVRGYKILRFTGSEIFKNPYGVAAEIIKAVTGDNDIVTPQEYFGG